MADDAGAPRFGTYEGSLPEVDLSRLTGQYRPAMGRRLLKHKKWLYAFAATREVVAVCAVVDVGYSSNSFCVAVDLKEQQVLLDTSVLGLSAPMVHVSDAPSAGLDVRFTSPGLRVNANRPAGSERFHLHTRAGLFGGKLDWGVDFLAAGAPPPLTVIAPVPEDGVVNVTQKWAGMLTFGTLQCAGRRFILDGGVGGLDYTHGYLARRTAWRWAFACGRLADGTPIGLNLVEGFNESRADVNENALWVGGRLLPLSRARFHWNKSDPLDKWEVSTDDGAVQLTFKPIHAHREERDYKLVKSFFMQPLGLFEGLITIDGRSYPVENLPGVTEDQDILW
jgi:hypothetical protein